MIYLTFNYKLSITIIYINYCLCFPVQIPYLGDNLNQVEAFYLIKKRQFYKQKPIDMKNLPKKLSREEMKKIAGGTNKFIWACYSGGTFLANVCSLTNPSDPANHCSGLTCTNTGVTCAGPFLCP